MDDRQDGHSDVDSKVDPRIQVELDELNRASKEINRLENELDDARGKYRLTFSDSSQTLNLLARRTRNSIARARAYYEIKESSKKIQSETLKAARRFQTANGIYRAAKETIALAEEKLIEEGKTAELSSAWQEMLNHATVRVMEAEKEKRRSQDEHHRQATLCAELELKIQEEERRNKRSIRKASPYFEQKFDMEIKLGKLLLEAKKRYAGALKKLEWISEEMHERRKIKALLMYPREPGVGAESEQTLCSSVSEMSLAPFDLSSVSAESDDVSSDTDGDDDLFVEQSPGGTTVRTGIGDNGADEESRFSEEESAAEVLLRVRRW